MQWHNPPMRPSREHNITSFSELWYTTGTTQWYAHHSCRAAVSSQKFHSSSLQANHTLCKVDPMQPKSCAACLRTLHSAPRDKHAKNTASTLRLRSSHGKQAPLPQGMLDDESRAHQAHACRLWRVRHGPDASAANASRRPLIRPVAKFNAHLTACWTRHAHQLGTHRRLLVWQTMVHL